MLRLTIAAIEQYDEEKNEFVTSKEQVLQLEHSLVSLSKWESKWLKPFLTNIGAATFEEMADYIRCMTITQNVNPEVYSRLTAQNIQQVTEYINAPMTATTISNQKSTRNKEILTSEVIYYMMTVANIPFECQKWHLNRLLTLINVCNIKASKPEKMGRRETMRQNATLNAARRRKFNSRG